MTFNAAEDSANPFWAPAQPSQPGQETAIRNRSAFIPNMSIDSPEQSPDSPTSFMLSTEQALSSHAPNALSPAHIDSSYEDSDFSPDTSPTKSAFTPKKSDATSIHSV